MWLRKGIYMTNYAMIVSYDGTRYEGWQKQPRSKETIQGKIEDALLQVTGEVCQVNGAGRTDAGVHAKGQCANFRLPFQVPADKLIDELNRALPDDIGIMSLKEAAENFHARFSSSGKRYRYRIRIGSLKNVFERRYVWQLGKPLDVEAMRKAARILEGTHDFTSFTSNRHMKKSAVRTVEEIRLTEEEGELRIDYTGDGFLQNMIRIMTGTLVEIGEGKRSADDLAAVLEGKVRAEAGFTAPAAGLTLLRVFYD